MNPINAEVWARLATERPLGRNLRARTAIPEVTDRLVAALDAEGRRHLLLLLAADDVSLQDARIRGVGVVTRELTAPGHAEGRYLDITCHEVEGHGIFDLLGGELAERLANADEAAPEAASRVLSKWRRFWGQIPHQVLSREAQIGLFGEIWFLSVWLVPRVGAMEGVSRWHGPFGARHDFEWTGKSVEVKATTSTRGRIHHINGVDQLVPPDGGTLVLFSMRLREEGGAKNSLPAIVAACRARFAADADALARYETALLEAGYSPSHEEEYSKLKLRVVEERLFSVERDFPRVTPEVFPMGVPPGVERVEYEVNLNGYDHLLLAASPATEDWL